MTRQRKFLAVACIAIFALTSLAATSVEAQTPWRANMYNANKYSQRSYSRSYNYNPSYSYGVERAPATQSLSVAPITIGAGDKVKVTVDTPLRLGQKILATVPEGETHDVLKVIGPWVGIVVNQNGEELHGWVNYRALDELE